MCIPVLLALGRQRQEGQESEAILCYTVNWWQETPPQNYKGVNKLAQQLTAELTTKLDNLNSLQTQQSEVRKLIFSDFQ